jgi:hypothetical protein
MQESVKLAYFNNCIYKQLIKLKRDLKLKVKYAFI